MKNLILLIMVLLVSVLTKAERPRMTLKQEFTRTYQRVLEINQTRFSDLKKIQIGEIILVPSRWDERDLEFIELLPPTNGKHDCIWSLVHRYVYGEAKVFVPRQSASQTARNRFMVKPKVDHNSETPKSNNLWWLAILPILPLTIGGRKWWLKKHDPDSFPPVGQNLDSLEPAAIIAEIQRVFEINGSKVIEVKRGGLVRSEGPDRIKVKMKFGDNKDRNVWIFPNESVCKTKIRDLFGKESYQFCRSACTNGMVLDKFDLPIGWSFVTNKTTLNPENSIVTPTAIKADPEKIIPVLKKTEEVSEAPVFSRKKITRCKKNKHRCRTCKKFNPEFGNKRRVCGFKAKNTKIIV